MFSRTWLLIAAVLLVFLFADCQDDDEFSRPVSVNRDIDSFVYERTEYLVIDFDLKFSDANLYCAANYRAKLAEVRTEDIALFLADALSETNHDLDNLWVGGKKRGNTWEWYLEHEPIDEELLEKYYLQRGNETEFGLTRECLGFRRNVHNDPTFVSLSCSNPRPVICERKLEGESGEGGISTHPGWIKIRDRYYKIYRDRVSFDNASKNCIRHDQNARLAVLETTQDARQLSRYLLIGRPSLENAWIGGRWNSESGRYEFAAEDLVLDSETDDATGYPPWRDGAIKKKGGCLLLDRHLNSTTYFVEARCARFRPYVCYKKSDVTGIPAYPDYNYVVYYDPKPWGQAKAFCQQFSRPGDLAEARGAEDMRRLLFVMGENFTAINHIWLNGLHEEGSWRWQSDRAEIPVGQEYPPWVSNDTFTVEVEDNNRCLNLDRENHNAGLFYGTDCSFPQSYVCYFRDGIPEEAMKPEGQIPQVGDHSPSPTPATTGKPTTSGEQPIPTAEPPTTETITITVTEPATTPSTTATEEPATITLP